MNRWDLTDMSLDALPTGPGESNDAPCSKAFDQEPVPAA
jgi:hypothetical protein